MGVTGKSTELSHEFRAPTRVYVCVCVYICASTVVISLSICCSLPLPAAVPDVERLVERLQHGLQHDGHAGARLQEDQLLPDDPLRGDTTAGLREGVRGPESHLVSVHTHALGVWGLRALHVGSRAAGERDALFRARVREHIHTAFRVAQRMCRERSATLRRGISVASSRKNPETPGRRGLSRSA